MTYGDYLRALVKRKPSLPQKVNGLEVDLQELFSQAIQRGDVNTAKELVAMRREMKAEVARENYFKALSGFQHECPVIQKEKIVRNKKKEDEKEGKKRYTYAPIEDIVAQVKELLDKWGFSFTFKSRQEKGSYTAICVAHHKDGHEEATEFMIPVDFADILGMSAPQEQGAACTYADRYAFKNAFGIVTKGDDTDAVGHEGDERRKPIQKPQERNGDAVPVKFSELPDYDKIMRSLEVTEVDPKSKLVVKLFSDNERIDYAHEANENKDKPDELKKILSDIIDTGKHRRATIKGE
jgi:ERF superfamily